ncbi:hypothetical protein TIFTF001_017524 [Ficus carica]|uniref:RNase H type-1 domain-containing protein n=1 Tax=Ficus carica TaxID=3494 RepID=A0AA88D9T1_FICCA|nr:hypothetical protein TIFTF001_017524 [Ficus carica]
MWYIWWTRNVGVFEDVWKSPTEILEGAGRLLGDFNLCRVSYQLVPTSRPSLISNWIKPRAGTFKLNVDYVVLRGSDYIGIGAIIRMMLRGAEIYYGSWDAISVAKSDSMNVVQAVNSCDDDATSDVVVQDTKLCLNSATSGSTCSHVLRRGNMVAHQLASLLFCSLLFCSSCDLYGIDAIPSFIREVVLADLTS